MNYFYFEYLFFFVIFNRNVFSTFHAKHFEIWKFFLWNWWVDCLIAQSIKWCDISGCSFWIHFTFDGVDFFSQEKCVSIGLRVSYLSLNYFWQTWNHFHNILRLLDLVTNFSFNTSETMCDSYLLTWYLRFASWVTRRWKCVYVGVGGALPTQKKRQRLLFFSKLGNVRKVSKLHKMIA